MRKVSRALACVLTLTIVIGVANAQAGGYAIDVEVEGFAGDSMFLANYFMDKQYIVDTVIAESGKATFRGEDVLPEGTYLLVLPPDNEYAQIMLDSDQQFGLKTDVADLAGAMRVDGSEENELFYGYLNFITRMRPRADSLRAVQQDSTLLAATRESAKNEGLKLDEQVKQHQAEIRERHPGSMTAALLRTMVEPELPTFTGTEAEQQEARYHYYKNHYFDGVDLGDPRALRSTWLDQRVSDYIENLVVPAPDSISKELDMILDRMRPAPETFRFYTSKFLNDYAASKIVGMDAVYVHLGKKYYVGGEADWVDSTTLAKIAENVATLEPLLIGKPAPPLTLKLRDESDFVLHDTDAKFTVLFFYDPECSHCKKQTPFVIEFAEKYRDKGVKTVAVCSKFAPNVGDCWTYVDENEGMKEAIVNTADPYHKSKYKVVYDITSTPQIYVLDKDKKIVSKRISAEQLPEVLDRMLEEGQAGGPAGPADGSGR